MDRPCNTLKVANRTYAPYGVMWQGGRVIFKVLVCTALVFILIGTAGIWLRRSRDR
ncbi:hypothetical protein Asi02nite_56350 [Asanoa siamensis]|uniref:Uncharacterized protein n=1 Tax=Asanoa siamensis TaxID=926357 RepID=A0ABQ4CZ26_9ACTN|nr:hypothetical protein Asi02nite_56350 [Asanoa siamensis]